MRGEGPLASEFTQDQKLPPHHAPVRTVARAPRADRRNAMGITRRIFGVGMHSSALTASRDSV